MSNRERRIDVVIYIRNILAVTIQSLWPTTMPHNFEWNEVYVIISSDDMIQSVKYRVVDTPSLHPICTPHRIVYQSLHSPLFWHSAQRDEERSTAMSRSGTCSVDSYQMPCYCGSENVDERYHERCHRVIAIGHR